MSEFEMPSDVSEHAQRLFVEERKKEHEESGGKELKTTAETFH